MFLLFSEFVFPFAVFSYYLNFFVLSCGENIDECTSWSGRINRFVLSMVRLYRSVNTYWLKKYNDARPHAFRRLCCCFHLVSFRLFAFHVHIYICYSVCACSRIRLLPKLYIHMHTTHQLARSSVRLTNRLVAGKSSAVAVPVTVQTLFACVYALI